MHGSAPHDGHGNRHYVLLLGMTVVSFASMFALMYAMVDRFANVVANWNQVYMAVLMTAPMMVIELLFMRFMYPNKRLNLVLVAIALVVGAGCFLLIRRQAGVGDRQFLKSMIPHHAAALLMCEEASLEDPRVKDLCRRIRASQQAEIDEMKAILERLGR